MEKRLIFQRRLWIVAALVALSVSVAAKIGLCQIEPVGRKANLIQFDAISEINKDWGFINTVVFARYWVCQDYYAVSVVWSEPHGGGFMDMKTAVVLSDRSGFRMDNELYPNSVPTNMTYPKPLSEKGPFRWGGGFYEGAEMRFAEAEALSRRVYVGDLGQLKDLSPDVNKVADLNVPEGPDGIQRKLARLKVHARSNQIGSMDLFDGQQRPLARMRYEYGLDGNQPRIARIIADLPVRPEKLAVDANITVSSTPDGMRRENTYKVANVDHVSHKGGRTCTVVYKDVSIGDQVLRLPENVEVRVSEDNSLLRSVRLMNFRQADLDKIQVWESAKAFAGLGKEYWAFRRLVPKYLDVEPMVGFLQVDPNDLAFVRRLVAKYPVYEPPPLPPHPELNVRTRPSRMEMDPQQRRMEMEARKQRFSDEVNRIKGTPRPERRDIEPNDLRVIRQLDAYYLKRFSKINGQVPESELEAWNLSRKLGAIPSYHRVPPLPEDRAPELEPNDLVLIRQLQGHYERLAVQQDRGLWGHLKAIHVLTSLDRMLKDYDAFEGHTLRYLRKLQEAGLPAMYMDGGYDNIETLMEAGRYEKATRLMRQWAERSGADNDPDGILRYTRWHVRKSSHWWTGVHLLDRFLKRSGLSPVQRYEGLALRTIALHKIDRLLASPEAMDNEQAKAQAQWILSTTTRQEVAKMVEPALRQALSAWQFLGTARLSDAKPYSTVNMPASVMNTHGYPEATGLQETSALLDRIVRERTGQPGTGRSKTGR